LVVVVVAGGRVVVVATVAGGVGGVVPVAFGLLAAPQAAKLTTTIPIAALAPIAMMSLQHFSPVVAISSSL
jgi:hypothetical protein